MPPTELRATNRRRALTRLLPITAALLTLVATSVAAAATASLSLRDAEGFGLGVDLFLTDGPEAGEVSITLDSVGPEKLVPDLLAIRLEHDVSALSPGLDVVGEDVSFVFGQPQPGDADTDCPCNVLAKLGGRTLFELTGITSTTVALTHPSEVVSLTDFEGAEILVYLALDGALFDDDELDGIGGGDHDEDDLPGFELGDLRVIKLKGTITVIPEPSTALLMALGLMGLAAKRERR